MQIRSFGGRKLRVVVGASVIAASALCASQATAGVIYAIDDQNNLFTFDNLAPQNTLTGSFISGLKSNEHLLNIDFRPADGVLYGIGSSMQVYTINPATGAATAVGPGFGPVQGNSFGMDFNPFADRIRFFSDIEAPGTNLRIFPNTGGTPGTGTDTSLAYVAGDPKFGVNPNVVGAAYTDSTNPPPGTGITTLYGIDSNTDTLVRVGSVGGVPTSPNTGQLTTIGALGVDTNNFVGFDITANNIAFAAFQLTNSSASHLYAINLATGQAIDQGQIIGGVRVVDITTEPNVNFVLPEPASMLTLGAVSLGLISRRRKTA